MSKSLEQKNTLYLLLWLPLVLFFGSVLFFIMLTMHSHHMQEKQLTLRQQNIWNAFADHPLSLAMQIPGEYLIEPGTRISATFMDEPRDTIIYYQKKDEIVSFKILTKQYTLHGKPYQLTTYVSSKEFYHLIIKVFATEIFVFLLLLLSIVIINRKSSKWLWKPFHDTLQTTSGYHVVHDNRFQLQQETGIAEFDQLNKELTKLIDNVNQAYTNQKNFVENASHEIQTPLAIIRSKLELLINEPGLTEKTAALLADITEASDRLSQLNKSLLLLAKIDNNQFPEQQEINLSEMLEKIFTEYRDHYDNFPVLTLSIEKDVYLTANRALTGILFSNLIKNSVVHNIPGGYIKVYVSRHNFIIENSGPPILDEPALLFERFRKGNANTKTTGLGLSLVQQIIQMYKMGVYYSYGNGIHRIEITF
jgi:signal transduction histidine kinase